MGRLTSGLAWMGYQCLFGDVFVGGAGLVPWLAAREQRVREGFPHYLGGVPRPPDGPLVWVHGVSLGESLVACALMERLRREWPAWRIGFTTTHPEVLALVRKKKLADVAGYFPLDFAPFLWRAVGRWRPRLVVVAETDLWPGLAGVCRARGVPLVLVNGRISHQHRAFWTRARALGASLWGGFTAFGVQGAVDRDRLVEMGADPRTVSVLGNIKVDLVPPRREDCLGPVRAWRGADTLVVFGSLHPAEFDALVPGLVRLAARPGMRVLVAPRAIVHAAAWERRLREAGAAVGRRSAPGGP
ncbi:MAG: hypothetical protein GX442_11220, partial [Candidatus Riflebacteria bacterium]|nr:hypothetical protein [Candidatus Riflebacteria bacterium]